MHRLFSYPIALLGAFVYVLFPADTTKILLVHAAHVQGSMTFLLAGIFLWQSGGFWRWCSYIVASLCLLSYETAFLPFVAVPLLWAGDRKSTWRTWLLHLGLCAAIVALISFVRMRIGETRISDALADPGDTVHMVLTSLYLGPLTSLRMLGKGALIGLQHIGVAGIASTLLLTLVVFICRPYGTTLRKHHAVLVPRIWPDWLDRRRTETGGLPWWWILGAGLLMLSVSYALTLTNYPPILEYGRLTSTHVAAGLGTALAVAALMEGARRNFSRFTPWLTALVCIWIGTLVLYHDYIQREYVRAWQLQKQFWYQVASLAPEVGPGWDIIVTGNPAAQSQMIASNSWADFHVATMLFNANPASTTPAFVHLGVVGYLIHFTRQGDSWEWNPRFWGEPPEKLETQRLVILNSEEGKLSRIQFIDTPAGRLESTAPLPDYTRMVWPNTLLAHMLLNQRANKP